MFRNDVIFMRGPNTHFWDHFWVRNWIDLGSPKLVILRVSIMSFRGPYIHDVEGLRSGRLGTGYPQMAQRAVATDIQGMGISRRPVKDTRDSRPSLVGFPTGLGTPKMVIFGGSEILGSGV